MMNMMLVSPHFAAQGCSRALSGQRRNDDALLADLLCAYGNS